MKALSAFLFLSTGAALFLALDMIFGDGRLIAHNLHKATPNCSVGCHGQKPDR